MEKILGEVREICRCCELPGSESRKSFLRAISCRSSRTKRAAGSSNSRIARRQISASGVSGEATGGSADSGFTAALGTPTQCGTGPVGGNAHRDDEWCRIDTMVPRAQALALTVLAVGAARGVS